MEDILTRKEAKEIGAKRYFTGKPCQKGHLSERHTNCGSCIVCKKDRSKQYHIDNREQRNESSKKRRQENPEVDRAYREKHKERAKEYKAKWYQDNKPRLSEEAKEYYMNNREEKLAYIKQWRKDNPDYQKNWREDNPDYDKEYYQKHHAHIRKRRNKRRKERYYEDVDYKLMDIMRSQLRKCLSKSNSSKTHRTATLAGYSSEELKIHLENNMLSGMTWDNFGEGWHIDHLYPMSRFFIEGVTDPAIVNNLDNLIPMYAHHNIKKSDKTLEEWLSEKGENSEEYRLYGHYLNKE